MKQKQKSDGQVGLLHRVTERHFHHPTAVYVHAYALYKHCTNQMKV